MSGLSKIRTTDKEVFQGIHDHERPQEIGNHKQNQENSQKTMMG